jgi:hypothetical protein
MLHIGMHIIPAIIVVVSAGKDFTRSILLFNTY